LLRFVGTEKVDAVEIAVYDRVAHVRIPDDVSALRPGREIADALEVTAGEHAPIGDIVGNGSEAARSNRQVDRVALGRLGGQREVAVDRQAVEAVARH
jgi:hypothetical protein